MVERLSDEDKWCMIDSHILTVFKCLMKSAAYKIVLQLSFPVGQIVRKLSNDVMWCRIVRQISASIRGFQIVKWFFSNVTYGVR